MEGDEGDYYRLWRRHRASVAELRALEAEGTVGCGRRGRTSRRGSWARSGMEKRWICGRVIDCDRMGETLSPLLSLWE
jgi:hypothetical protein